MGSVGGGVRNKKVSESIPMGPLTSNVFLFCVNLPCVKDGKVDSSLLRRAHRSSIYLVLILTLGLPLLFLTKFHGVLKSPGYKELNRLSTRESQGYHRVPEAEITESSQVPRVQRA